MDGARHLQVVHVRQSHLETTIRHGCQNRELTRNDFTCLDMKIVLNR
jgi:hypothetical protein